MECPYHGNLIGSYSSISPGFFIQLLERGHVWQWQQDHLTQAFQLWCALSIVKNVTVCPENFTALLVCHEMKELKIVVVATESVTLCIKSTCSTTEKVDVVSPCKIKCMQYSPCWPARVILLPRKCLYK